MHEYKNRSKAMIPVLIAIMVVEIMLLWMWYYVPPVPTLATTSIVYFENGKTKHGHPTFEAKIRKEKLYLLN